jgi:hypothetical protein
MNAKQSDPDRYSYSALETAIGVVFGVDEAGQRGWLRGRIQNLRRLGLTPEGPGSGRAISYSYEYGLRWLIGIEFGFLHVDPSTTAAFIHEHWDPIQTRVQEARDASPGGWDDVLLTIKFNSVMAKTPDVWTTTVRGMDAVGHSLLHERIGLSIFNLSELIRAFDKALANPAPPRQPEPTDPKVRAILAAGRRARGEE